MFRIQSTLLRIYVGLDFIHHFAEKFGLLGADAYARVSGYFNGLGLSHPQAMLMLAGLCEFGAFVAFTFGLCMRGAAVGTALYLVVAAGIGGHFSMGFTWANPGGGWEFPLFWAAVCLSFVLTGAGDLSLDRLLRERTPSPLNRLFR